MKILRNAIKLAAGEVTRVCVILIKISKNLNFEFNIWKNMQQNVRIKISCQNWAYNLHFVVWDLDLRQVLLCISKFSRIEKNWVEDAITFSVKKKNRLALNSFFFWHQFYVRFLLKADVLVYNFWTKYTEVLEFLESTGHFLSYENETQLDYIWTKFCLHYIQKRG